MRLSTSPVGPLMVLALACAGGVPALAGDTVDSKASQIDIIAPGELRGAVENPAWQFLYQQDAAIHANDLPPPDANKQTVNPAEKPLTDEERARLGEALLLTPHELGASSSKKVHQRSTTIMNKPRDLEVSRTQRSFGASTVVFNKPIAPATSDWNAKIGADLGMADTATTATRDNPLRIQRDGRGANAAWASVDVNEFASVDARVNPGSDQGVVATTFKRSVPIGSHLSMTLQSRTSVTETFGRGSASSYDIPMAALPASDGTTAQRVWGQENTARFKILSTGTSFGAGVSANSVDTVTHNTLTAEQQVYGPLSVSTAINNIGRTDESRSLNARAKFKW